MAHGLSPSVGSDEDSQSIPGVSCEEGFEHRMGVSLERIVRSLGEARVHELCDHCGEGTVPPTLCVERVLGDEYFCFQCATRNGGTMRQMEVLDYMRLGVRSCADCGTETVQPVVGVDPLHLRTMQVGQDLTVQETTWCPACASLTAKRSLAGRLTLSVGILFRDACPAFLSSMVDLLDDRVWRDPTWLEIAAAAE